MSFFREIFELAMTFYKIKNGTIGMNSVGVMTSWRWRDIQNRRIGLLNPQKTMVLKWKKINLMN